MGYCMDQRGSNFKMQPEGFDAALAAIKGLMEQTDLMSGGSFGGGEKKASWFSWVDTGAVLMAETLTDAMAAWRWDLSHECGISDMPIDMIWFQGEKLGDDAKLFSVIAPFVDAGSSIEMCGEDGSLWRWFFDGISCSEEIGRIEWGEE